MSADAAVQNVLEQCSGSRRSERSCFPASLARRYVDVDRLLDHGRVRQLVCVTRQPSRRARLLHSMVRARQHTQLAARNRWWPRRGSRDRDDGLRVVV